MKSGGTTRCLTPIFLNSSALEYSFFLHHSRRTGRTSSTRARTASHHIHFARTLSEGAETVGQGDDHVAAEGVVAHFLMVVGCIRDGQVLGLVEDIVAAEGECELVFEEKLLDVDIDHDLVLLRS